MQIVSAGGSATGSIVEGGGRLAVRDGGTLDNATIVGGGTVILSAGAIDTGSVTFVSHGDILEWGGSGTLGATLAGFAVGDTLDLTALGYVSGGTATLSDLVLSVTEGGATDKIAFASANAGGTAWNLTSGVHGGTDVTLVASAT